MLKGKISADSETSEDQKEDDYRTDINSIQRDYDSFSLIKLHKPLIDYYYRMLHDNNQDSQLFLCDTRLADYYGIEKSLNLNAKNVQMWFKETDYDADKKIALEFFSSAHENADTDFNIDEAKEILRQIFLMPDEGGVPYQWHDYQHPCLNEILPAKKDLLIYDPNLSDPKILKLLEERIKAGVEVRLIDPRGLAVLDAPAGEPDAEGARVGQDLVRPLVPRPDRDQQPTGLVGLVDGQ
jgi:ATP-dependent DNA helicase RecQ